MDAPSVWLISLQVDEPGPFGAGEVGVGPLLLLGVALALAYAARRISRGLPAMADRMQRPMAIAMGALVGVAAALPLAIVVNPFAGLQAGTWFNLMILAMCLGFLGFIVGSLGGLMYGGMILTARSRTMHAGHAGAASSAEKPRNDAPPPSFGSILAEAERMRAPHTSRDPGGEG